MALTFLFTFIRSSIPVFIPRIRIKISRKLFVRLIFLVVAIAVDVIFVDIETIMSSFIHCLFVIFIIHATSPPAT
jgi:hypothetical protein